MAVGLGTDVAALGEDVVGFSSAADGPGAETPHPATMETAMIAVTACQERFPPCQVMVAP
jgi:hypothetical protein